MFPSIEQGVQAYKKELLAFSQWLQERRTYYGERHQHQRHWNIEDFRKYYAWGNKLTGMENALGLHQHEVRQFWKEVNLDPAITKEEQR